MKPGSRPTGNNILYRLPEYDTLIIKSTPSFSNYCAISLQTSPYSVEQDNNYDPILAEQANRATFYYAAIAWQNVGNSNSQPLAPGQLALLYRYGLGFSFTQTGVPGPPTALPPTLGDVQVLMNGEVAPIFGLDAIGAIAFQVPSDAPTSGTANFVALHPSTGQIIGTGAIPMAQFDPGFFADGSGGVPGIGLAAATNSTGGINGPGNPIVANNTNFITFYLTGGGPFPEFPTDRCRPPDLSTPSSGRRSCRSMAGRGLVPDNQIAYTGTSFYPGVWQINYLVSNKYGPGTHIIAVTMNGISSSIGPNGVIQVYFVSK